jgi:hypothetical protein
LSLIAAGLHGFVWVACDAALVLLGRVAQGAQHGDFVNMLKGVRGD